jgi:uncharacterized membrane protein
VEVEDFSAQSKENGNGIQSGVRRKMLRLREESAREPAAGVDNCCVSKRNVLFLQLVDVAPDRKVVLLINFLTIQHSRRKEVSMSKETPMHKHFQVERVILFSDAVFAIAITLLIIEIKVPAIHGEDLSESTLLIAMVNLIPKFIGFIVSFFMIGMYWTRHHTLFGYVTNCTPKLMWLNLFFLLSIILMPFSTGIFGEYSTPSSIHLKTPLIVYVLNICFSGLMLFRLWSYVASPSNKVTDGSLDPLVAKIAKARIAAMVSVFALAIPVSFLNPYAARYVPLLIPPIIGFINRRMAKETVERSRAKS